MAKKKICFVVAVPSTAQAFLKDHIEALSEDYDVFIAGNISSSDELTGLNVCSYQHIDIEREISIKNDLKAVSQLSSYFRKMKFDAVHSVTPKAGLVSALAGFLARIPVRIHIFTGQVWATRKGFMRFMLKSIDWLIAKLNTHILVDGASQCQFLIDEGVVSEKKAQVLGDGSIAGVNIQRFEPSEDSRKSVRQELNIADDKVVFVFMGRLNHDKGMYELLPAFDKLAETNKKVFLLLFGADEENVASTFETYKNLNEDNFLYYGMTKEPQRMLQAGDVFVLPTYREGFGSSVIEAACLGLPTITSDAYGVLDASIPDETGLRCKVGDVDTLFACMNELAVDEEKRKKLGTAGRNRVLERFAGSVVVKHWKHFYDTILR
ncbi:MAG: glycosyltransferase family 4 protein [Paludibacteraceae bacterium]|jgi:glycosyltransferase involved in cell wall biosynthesis|nr:glycosyltransferase family 4 protein [Paludibacteraceae bacterium]